MYRQILLLWLTYLARPCYADDISGGTVYQVIAHNCPRFAELLNKVDHADLLSSPSDFTVFAPNDTAFENLSPEALHEINSMDYLQTTNFVEFYTIHKIRLDITNVRNNEVRNSMSPDGTLFFNKRTRSNRESIGVTGVSEFYVNGALIVRPNVMAQNGIVQIIDRVLFPTSSQNALAYIQNPDQSWVKSLKFFQLMKLLRGDNYQPVTEINTLAKITLFVPNDDAFDKIPEEKLHQLQGQGTTLKEVIQKHFIPNQFIFTSWVQHNHGYPNTVGSLVTFRKPLQDKIFVYSGGVSAEIVYGNITVNNGVIHVVDTLLGFIYYTCLEQIEKDAKIFFQLLSKGSEEIRLKLTLSTGVTVLVPIDEAFDMLINVPWVNLNDQKLIDKILELHILQEDETLHVNLIDGNYNSRISRRTLYYGWPITVYNQRNESWIQGGYVRAAVNRSDVENTNGRVHFIDSVLGVPFLDIPAAIYYDEWLTRTYDLLQSVGMANYLRDVRYNPTRLPYRNYRNPTSNFGGQTIIPYSPALLNTALDPCFGCKFTFFIPNGTEIDHFHLSNVGERIMQTPCAMRHVFKRHMIRGEHSMERMGNGQYIFTTLTNEQIRITKYADKYVELLYNGKRARVVLMDIGATNGLIHIVDRILYYEKDSFGCVDAASSSSTSILCTLVIVLIARLLSCLSNY
ncbi:hypothetical protein ScPMuIL_002443 [Solemya velum]